MDPHCEELDVPIPHPHSTYSSIFPIIIAFEDGTKLIISTHIFNGLVTSSIRLNQKVGPEVGPSTDNFIISGLESSNNTRIYINKASYDGEKLFVETMDPTLLFNSDPSYLMRQVRSKFHLPRTYESQRASFHLVNNSSRQPQTVFRYCNYKKDSADADGKIASRIFMTILLLVLADDSNPLIPKRAIESLLHQCQDSTRKIPKIIQEILKLFGENDSIPFYYNKDLNSQLKVLAIQRDCGEYQEAL